jgi:hypothetical protein
VRETSVVRRRPTPLLATVVLVLLGGCSGSSPQPSGQAVSRIVAQRWVDALNRSDVRLVRQLACPDGGFRANEVADARWGTHLGPYSYGYRVRSVRVVAAYRSEVVIVQRLTTRLDGHTRVSDLAGTFTVLRRGGRWLVCGAAVQR